MDEPQGIAIRDLQPSDVEAYRKLLCDLSDRDRYYRFFRAVGDIGKDELIEGAPGYEVVGLLAEEDGRCVGVAHGVLSAAADAEIDVVVESHERHHGIGTQLVLCLIEQLRARGTRLVIAYSLPDNFAFAEVARACGFSGSFDPELRWTTWRLSLTSREPLPSIPTVNIS